MTLKVKFIDIILSSLVIIILYSFTLSNYNDKTNCSYAFCHLQTHPESLVAYVSASPEGNFTSNPSSSGGEKQAESPFTPEEGKNGGSGEDTHVQSLPQGEAPYTPPTTARELDGSNGHENNGEHTNNGDHTQNGNDGTIDKSTQQSSTKSGCLIATAAFGSELSPQVQFLRNFRDERILSTTSGSSFMTAFNTLYYSFSPQVADYERHQPWLQQMVRTAIYPLIGILEISENSYSLIPGEYGSIVAGITASSLIGIVYFTPLALCMTKASNRKSNFKIYALSIAAVTFSVIVSLLINNITMLMITTSAFVIAICAISSFLFAGIVMLSSKKISSSLKIKIKGSL